MTVEQFRRDRGRVEAAAKFFDTELGRLVMEILDDLDPLKGKTVNVMNAVELLGAAQGSDVLIGAGIHHRKIMDELRRMSEPIEHEPRKSQKGGARIPARAPSSGPTISR